MAEAYGDRGKGILVIPAALPPVTSLTGEVRPERTGRGLNEKAATADVFWLTRITQESESISHCICFNGHHDSSLWPCMTGGYLFKPGFDPFQIGCMKILFPAKITLLTRDLIHDKNPVVPPENILNGFI